MGSDWVPFSVWNGVEIANESGNIPLGKVTFISPARIAVNADVDMFENVNVTQSGSRPEY